MGIKTLPSITKKLIDFGRSPDTPVAVVLGFHPAAALGGRHLGNHL